MSNIRYINGWECACCKLLHATKEKADKCCEGKVERVHGWECADCFKVYVFEENAKNCCNLKDQNEVFEYENYDLVNAKGVQNE
jgi:hypothetical protein